MPWTSPLSRGLGRARYRRNCEAVSAKYGVPRVDFVARLRLANRDFVDNWHLVEKTSLQLLPEEAAALIAGLVFAAE
jgi:hypothetical protein